MTTELTNNQPSGVLLTLLKRTGRFFIPAIVAFSQLPFFLAAWLGALVAQTNAGLTPAQFNQTVSASMFTVFLGSSLILLITFFLSRQANDSLHIWSSTGHTPSESDLERLAWGQVSSLPLYYAITASIIMLVVMLAPVVIYQSSALQVSSEQSPYTIFGYLATYMVFIVIAILSIDRMLAVARTVLLPQRLENQIQRTPVSFLFGKFLIIGLTLIGVTALLLAPIGYHQTYTAVTEPINSIELFNTLRFQLITYSIVVVIVGLGVTFLLSRSITSPIQTLIQTFSKVESGDLTQRANVTATDEIGELAIYFNRMISRLDEFQQTLEKRVADRTEQLRVSNEVGRIASTILDPDTVISRVVELITGSFNYYYSAIFLVAENGRWAELKDATGTAGAILKARHHRLPVNNASMVGAAITNKEPQVALDVGESAIRFNNPLLPNTRSEIAIPLIVGDRVIGALDVQSVRSADFKTEDLATLQNMANQVAIAIENARLFTEMEQALEELRQTNQQYVASAWADRLRAAKMEYATGSASAITDQPTREVEVKLNLRDENIGHIVLETAADWSQDDQAWVEALATQVAISLENARLVEESQQAALRERVSASIIQKLWSTSSVDAILQTAVRELGSALDASEATIELKVQE